MDENIVTYLTDCEYYVIQNYTDRTLSITVQFANESIFNIQKELLFIKYDKLNFEDRGGNGLVIETRYDNKKVVLHLHQSTYLLHIQGASCVNWFENIFKFIAMEIHNMQDSILFDTNNSFTFSQSLETSKTDPKQMLTNTSDLSDTLTGSVRYTSAIEIPCGLGSPVQSSTPRTYLTPKQSCCHDT